MASDLYVILGVPRNASAQEIRRAYRFLAKSFHPDKFPNPTEKAQAAEHFKRINEAHLILSDPKRRRAYDAQQTMHQPPVHGRIRNPALDLLVDALVAWLNTTRGADPVEQILRLLELQTTGKRGMRPRRPRGRKR